MNEVINKIHNNTNLATTTAFTAEMLVIQVKKLTVTQKLVKSKIK